MKAKISTITSFQEGETDVTLLRTYISRRGGSIFLNFVLEDSEGMKWLFTTSSGELTEYHGA